MTKEEVRSQVRFLAQRINKIKEKLETEPYEWKHEEEEALDGLIKIYDKLLLKHGEKLI